MPSNFRGFARIRKIKTRYRRKQKKKGRRGETNRDILKFFSEVDVEQFSCFVKK